MKPLGPGGRFLAWLVTGPVGRLVSFLIDVGVYWLRWARGRIAALARRRD